MLPLCSQTKLRFSNGFAFILVVMMLMFMAFSTSTFAVTADQTTNQTEKTTDKTWVANDSPDAQQILENITSQVPSLMRFVTALAYVMGMYLIFMGILKLKQYGEARTQMSSQHHLKGPLIFVIIGALLLYLPTTVQVGLSTFWTNPTPYAYVTDKNEWAPMYRSIFLVLQLFGTIALVRGLLMLSHLGGGGGGQNSLAKGMTHIIGGLLCINLYGLVEVILITFGFLK